MVDEPAAAWRRIERAARSQNGVVTREQLLRGGLSPEQIKTLVRHERLHRIHRGIYGIAHPSLLPFAAHTAALLSLGERAVLSHRTAASIWSLAKPHGVIDAIVPGSAARPRQGVRTHRAAVLDPRDIRYRHNLKLTAPARALIDFATDASARELEHALAEARALRLITDHELEAAIRRAPANHPGAAAIKRLLKTQTGRALTRSQRERLMLSLIEKAQLPPPLVNTHVHGQEVDFYWPQHKLVVEFDGYTTHGTRAAFERDRKRDQILTAHGLRATRVTDRQLLGEAMAVAARIAQAIALSA
jgi:very-short-patch-repair endonuclease